MRPNLKSIIVLLLLYNVIIITVISVSGQEFQTDPFVALSDAERNKRAFDLGFLVRNILLKSAYASNTKAAVSRNLLNAKLAKATTTTTTPRPTTRRPAPATLPPFFVNKKSFLFPFDFSASSGAFQPFNKFNNVQGNPAAAAGGSGGGGGGGVRGAYMNFDYDYVDPPKQVAPPRRRRPTTTTAAPTTTTTTTTTETPPPPPPAAALPPRRRPFGGYVGRPKFLNYDYYDDYDYPEIEPTTAAPPPPPPPPPPSRRPRIRRPPQQNQAPGPNAPLRTGTRQGRLQGRLRDPFNFQYAQKNDISINAGNAVPTADSAPATAGNANADGNNQTNANDDDDNANDANASDDDTTSPQDTNEQQTNQDAGSDDYDAGANAAFDPSNLEDYNDSSDNANANANVNSNGNGSNNDNTQSNTANTRNNNGPTNRRPLNNFLNNPAPSLSNDQFADFPITTGQSQGPAPLRPFGGLPSGYQNFQFPLFNDFNTQYQQPSSPVGYSVRYY